LSFLLDTNVISEWVKPQPHKSVIRWLDDADEDLVFISVITIAEIRQGLERLPKGRRRERIATWLFEDLPVRFDGRILEVDLAVAQEWGVAMEHARNHGITMSAMDGLLGASARRWGLTLVTRNTRDFAGLDVPIVDPWANA
jgi:predicted nucleic acid-binding protein